MLISGNSCLTHSRNFQERSISQLHKFKGNVTVGPGLICSNFTYRIIKLLSTCTYYSKYMLNKVYALNKQVSKYGVMVFFSNKTLILIGYGSVLSHKRHIHVALPNH